MKSKGHRIIKYIVLASTLLMFVVLIYLFQSTFFKPEKDDDPIINNPHPTDIYKEERNLVLNQAETLRESYYYQEALNLLEEHKYLSNEDTQKLLDEIQKEKDNLVVYNGRIEHLFFHSLIVDSVLAYGPTSSDPKGYDLWMITVNEFKEIIKQLKDCDFVLVMLDDVYEKNESGWKRKELHLPPGKKPILFSVDNIGYTDSRIADGFASKLLLDKDNKLISEITKPDRTKILSKEGDIFPILETFISAYPSFSYQDARAMLGVTGNMGILGYNPQSNQESVEVTRLVDVMKELGWQFVNHSWTHAGGEYFSSESILSKVQEDFNKFHSIITPIIGETNVFIAPFGVKVKPDIFKWILDEGYDVYAIVDRRGQPIIQGESLILPRVNIDGFTMRNDKEYINEHFFDVASVFDPQRNP